MEPSALLTHTCQTTGSAMAKIAAEMDARALMLQDLYESERGLSSVIHLCESLQAKLDRRDVLISQLREKLNNLERQVTELERMIGKDLV